MAYFQRNASPLPDVQAILHFEFGGAARHVVIRLLLNRWSIYYILYVDQNSQLFDFGVD